MSPDEDFQSLSEHLSQRTVSTLREWALQTSVADRFYIAPSQINLTAASGADMLLPEPPQSPTKSTKSSLVAFFFPSTQSTTSAEPATSSFFSDETAKSFGSEGPEPYAPPSSVPDLTNSSSSLDSISEDAESVEPIPRQGVQLLVPDGVEVLEEEHPHPTFQCCFWFLNCFFETSEEEEWNTHCLHHFKGARPPRANQCLLCDTQFFELDGTESWKRRMAHMAEHMRNGLTLATSRPDFHLFKYLWQQRIINDIDYQELMGNYHLEHAPRPFVLTNGPSRIRRQERLRPIPQPMIRI